jgi:hypothetical protein
MAVSPYQIKKIFSSKASSLIIAVKLQAKEKCLMAAMLFYIHSEIFTEKLL